MSVISIILSIIILSILVIVHEFGHFILAKKNGIFVKEFSVGFGPRIISHVSKKSGTRFSWKAIPFGGSCQMLGALEDEDVALLLHRFNRCPCVLPIFCRQLFPPGTEVDVGYLVPLVDGDVYGRVVSFRADDEPVERTVFGVHFTRSPVLSVSVLRDRGHRYL